MLRHRKTQPRAGQESTKTLIADRQGARVIYSVIRAPFLQLALPSTSALRGPTNDVSVASE
jgi:hypothetical protein